MGDPVRAADRLERILYIIPRASREGGVPIGVLADELGVHESTVVQDLTEVIDRAYYALPGAGDDLQIHLEGERVSVFTTGQFRRPARLSLRESLCLALGLRHLSLAAAGRGGERDGGRDALLRRLLGHLGTIDAEDAAEHLQAPDLGPDPHGIWDTVQACARERRRCDVDYLKPDDSTADRRTIHPYTLAHAEGHWYVLAWCESSEGVRAFRHDRILEAQPREDGFEVDGSFEPSEYLHDGRVYHSLDGQAEAVVRYAPQIARWIRERHPEARPDGRGGVLLRHPVADPRWLVRHVLACAPHAEVVEPESVRAAVRDVARRLS